MIHARLRHRTTVATVLTAGALGLLLAGCSSSAGADGGGDVTISYAIWDQNQKPAMQAIADAFEEENPDVTVDIQVTPFGEYFTKLQTAVTGGAGPDVFWLHRAGFQLYAANGMLAPLEVDTADYPASLVELYSYDGTTYGAPKDFDTIGLWYNKALFDAAGVEYPSADWTWEDLKRAAAALTDPATGQYGIAASQYGHTNFYDSIAQAGGEVISTDGTKTGFGSAEALAGITLWTDLIAAGSSPTAQQMTDTIPEDLFASGKVAMLQNGSWAALGYSENPALADAVDVAPLPAGPAGNQSVIHGLGNVVDAKGAHVDVAKKFALFASGEEAARIQAETGTVIPAFTGTQQAWVDAYPQYDVQVFLDAVDGSVPYPASKNTAAWMAIESEVLAQVWSGALTPEDGMAQLAEKVQAALDAESE